ncbi:MAG: bacillithiol biosynthesis cysteine-adding enzyme BshC [Acidobacteria bacterium]|nr:bacillithiol biosynthesis cysteine-adding enzyme BshC [Acidobacteriota bacterium]
MRIPVDVRRFPWIRRLAADYAYDFRSVAPFFSGDPADRTAWANAIARTQQHDRRRDAIAAVLATQQERRGAPARARDAARLLADRSTVAVVTGQQAGLFGGPLFTLFKALTAIKLAEQVSRDHHVPAVAVFWIDAEDHDWEEVRSCTVFDEALTPRSVSLPARPGAEPAPVATITLDQTVLAALDEIEQLLPPTEFRAPLMESLRRAYAPGVGMADAFGRWMESVLGDRGLIVYDSSDAASKPLVSQVFARELSMPGTTVKLAALAGSDLTARGYHAQVHGNDEGLALFHLDGGRRAIRQQDGGFVVGDQQFAAPALVEQATSQPAGFSPNVLLRPIVQDTIFPTICYVAGPNELAYLGQLRGVYEHFGVPMPLFYPRGTATILDSAALRFLTKYKLPLEALQAQDEAALNELLRTQIPPVVEESFTEAEKAIEAQMSRVVQAMPALDPTLEGAARSTLERMQRDLQNLHGKMIQAAKRRDETLRRQFIHARALAFPGGHAQERTIGFLSFLNQYGPALVHRLDEELPLDLGRHWIVTI